MADGAVALVVDAIERLLVQENRWIREAKIPVEKLMADLGFLNAFLKDCTGATLGRKDNTRVVQELVRQARDVIYEAEDVIDDLVSHSAAHTSTIPFLVPFYRHGHAMLLRIFSGQVEDVRAKIAHICSSKARFDIPTVHEQQQGGQIIKAGEVAEMAEKRLSTKKIMADEAPQLIREHNVVGFDDEIEAVIVDLAEGLDYERESLMIDIEEKGKEVDVITIVGMPGIGKTTLARKIFRDKRIMSEFQFRIWIHVSENFSNEDIFLSILRQANVMSNTLTGISVEELANLVHRHLCDGRFLIVMDDVRSADDWNKLRIAVPNYSKMGKVLITTCNEEVAWHANRFREPHKVRFLNEDESWLLLQLEVFGGLGKCPPDLENIGKLVAKQCGGLPLAVVVMGGVLAKKDYPSSDMRNVWIKACQDVPRYQNEKFYDDLPEHLQICFLYFGMFPPDFEIPVWKLISMWIAEGFIRKDYVDGVSLEETGEKYLQELIDRHLVVADQIRGNGKVKTCRIHHMLHDFCKIQAGKGKGNLLQEIIFTADGIFEPDISELPLYRRLCIHSNVFAFLSSKKLTDGVFQPRNSQLPLFRRLFNCYANAFGFLHSKPSVHRVRSFVSYSKDEINLPPENNSAILTAFKLLRVFDVKPIRFSKIPNGIYQLVHLRYLTLYITLPVLPIGFSKLRNVQTLIVDTTSRTLEIKADIWKLTQLRHIKINASATLPKTNHETKDAGENLQTLGMISPQSCTEELFRMARNLKKLGIRGQLSLFFDGSDGSFDSMVNLNYLEKLKLINDLLLGGQVVRNLPPAYKFPPRLKNLTLANTYLNWSQMSILGLLEKLVVLKVKDNAFVGQNWVTDDDGVFRSLEALYIGRTDLVIWVASAYHFPKLRHLKLEYCEELQEVPIELAEIASFRQLDMYRTKLAATSANRILERKQKYLEGRSKKDYVFKLSIYPPVNDALHPY